MKPEEIVSKFQTPWLTWSEAVEMCRLAGFTEGAWREKFRDQVKTAGPINRRRYWRDDLAEVLGLVSTK